MAIMLNMRRGFKLGAASLLGLAVAHANTRPAEALSGLLQNSPFGAPAAVAGVPESMNSLEFRGMFADRGETFFSLYEESSHSSRWVGLKEDGNHFTVQSYDSTKGEVQVAYHGRTLTLGLKQAKVVLAVSPPPPGFAPLVQSAVTPGAPVVVPSATSDDAARLAHVAVEIRRHRVLRLQAQQQPQRPLPRPLASPK